MQEISASLSIPFTRVMIFPPAYVSVRLALAKIRREYPDDRFTFDLSGGSKELCLALFAFAPWLGGEVYAAFDEKTARTVPLPDRTISSLLSNPNHQTILAILLNRKKMKKDATKGTVPAVPAVPEVPALWVSRQYLYKQLWSVYVPSRTKKEKPVIPQSRLFAIRRAKSLPLICPTPPSPGLSAPSAMPGSLRSSIPRRAGKRRVTGLRKRERLPSGSFPILPPARWSGACWRVPEAGPGPLFCIFWCTIFRGRP